MQQCPNPYYLDENRAQVRAGKAVYPDRDERLGAVNEPVGFPCYRASCEVCTGNRKNRWAGKCLAEQSTSVAANFVTCTYKTDHPHADKLIIGDGQRWIKRIRASGKYPLSYLWVFEKGTENRRSHIHGCLFWHKNVPKFSQGENGAGRNYNDQFWPDGMVHYKPLTEANLRYCLKYILPDNDADPVERLFRKSTKPPLGHKYFENRALEFVKAGLAPQDSIFSFPDVRVDHGPLKGQPKHFSMDDPLRDRFLASYVRQWQESRPGEPLPESEYVQAHLDRQARLQLQADKITSDPTGINLRDTGSYYGTQSGLVLPGRWRERG